MHGFPDSYLLWRHLLQDPALQQTNTLIALDLPGYGGSDGLPNYGPNEMLEAMAETIIALRKQFLQDGRKCVVVSHDWGALTCARLASEASELADRWLITSAIIVSSQTVQLSGIVLTYTAPSNRGQCPRPVDLGAPDAAHMEKPSLKYCSSQERP